MMDLGREKGQAPQAASSSYYVNSIHITRFNRFAFFSWQFCRFYGLAPGSSLIRSFVLSTFKLIVPDTHNSLLND